MDAEQRVIPIVEDDQGEGMKDPITLDDLSPEAQKEMIEEALKKDTQNDYIMLNGTRAQRRRHARMLGIPWGTYQSIRDELKKGESNDKEKEESND